MQLDLGWVGCLIVEVVNQQTNTFIYSAPSKKEKKDRQTARQNLK